MNIGLSLRLLWRDWRSGELNLLLASLVIAVATVTTITLFVDRLQQALLQESATFLAADRIIVTDTPIDRYLLDKASEMGLRRAETVSFLSMVFSSDRAQFSSVKAVSAQYPLRGSLIISDRAFELGETVYHGPAKGEVWLESRLLPSLNLQPGSVLDVGVASFKVSKALIKEPDKGGGFNSVGPRVMMNLADVEKTQVVQPGSRLTYRYLFAGDKQTLIEYEDWVKPKLGDGSRILGVKQGTAAIGDALERAERFLLLGGLLGVILAGVAIALSAQRYSHRHFDHVAILKTLGATPTTIDGLFLVIFFVLGLIATLLGSGVGYVAQKIIVMILQPFIPISLPAAGMEPVILGLVTGFICLLSFALPPLLKLRSTEPLRVIRRDLDTEKVSSNLAYFAGITGTLILMWWYSGDLKLTLMIFTGGAVAVVVLFVIAYLILRSGGSLGMQAGSIWRLALSGMQRRGQENTLQILVFGLAIMLLLIMFLVRTALVSEWQAQISENAPNHFAINIAPEDVAPIRALLAANEIRSQEIYPMIRGRVETINKVTEREIKQDGDLGTDREGEDEGEDEGEGEGDRGAPRSNETRNLTYSSKLPDDNIIESGEWWPEDYAGKVLVSVEQDIARHNNIELGDELIFDIQGRELAARVSSIRHVNWDNMQPNFYMILSPGALKDFPSTYMTSFFLDAENKIFLNELLRSFPTMTVIEVDAIIRQIKVIITQVTLAIELVLVLILISGAMVLLASIQASMDERIKQHAILRTLGASQKLVMGSLVIEFCSLGFFAGILATVGAEVSVYALEVEIFQLEYHASPWLWVVGPLIGAVLIGSIGTLATLKVVKTPPLLVLRNL